MNTGIRIAATHPEIDARLERANVQPAVITGIGVVSPIGANLPEFWQNLMSGKTGVGPITRFNPETYPTRVAAEIKDFSAGTYLTDRQQKYYSRASQFACVAARMALDDAEMAHIDPYRTDVIIGSGLGSQEVVEEHVAGRSDHLLEYGEGIDPTGMLKFFISGPAIGIALMLGCKSYVTTVSSACASGLNSIGLAMQRIQDRRADVVICGGVDTPITRFVWAGLCAARFLTTNNDPVESMCPFDRRRSGGTLGEGAGIFIVESLEHARARGARIYAETAAFNQETENVNELYLMDKSGTRWAELIGRVCAEAGINRLDWINAHGPSDRQLDKLETVALKKALGVLVNGTPVSSIKGAVGAGMASSGAFQAAAGAMSLITGCIPPNYNYREPDPELDLMYVDRPLTGRNLKTILLNARAFGGINASLIMRRITA